MDPVSTQMVIFNQLGQWSTVFLSEIKSLLVALVVFVAGLFLAELAKALAVAILKAVDLDARCTRWGLTRSLQRVRPDLTPTRVVADLAFWLVLVSGGMKALQQLDVAWLAGWGRLYFEYLPLAAQAAVWLIGLGLLAEGLARLVLGLVEHPAAELAAGLLRSLVLSLAVLAALDTLGLDRGVSLPLICILFAAAGLALALGWAHGPQPRPRTVARVKNAGDAKR